MDAKQQEEITESNNNGGGLLIKVKMAKTEPFTEQGNQKPENLGPPPPPAPGCIKICKTCQKGFGSGKALGGHMRMHVQVSKGLIRSSSKSPKPAMVVKKNSPATEISTTSDSSDKYVCIECGQTFDRKKALFGHMRSHPDRPYRGIKPPLPQSAKNSSTSTLSDALAEDHQQIDSAARAARIYFGPNPKAVPDLVKIVPSWSQTARRGRTGNTSLCETNSDSDDSDDGYDDDDLDMSEAVHDLMMLAQANPKGAEEATNNNEDHDVKDRRVSEAKKRKQKLEIDEDGDELELRLDLKEDSADGDFSDSENSENIVLANMMKRKRRRKMKLKDLDGGFVAHQDHPHKVYTCSLCNKSFQSHQALGGHMSSHNKVKNNNHHIIYSVENDHHPQSGSDEDTTTANAAIRADHDQAESHQCTKCDRTFPTGQALGGHMRSHYTGPNDQEAQTGHKGLDIDLNEPPPMEYEQGIDNSGVCSYNSFSYLG